MSSRLRHVRKIATTKFMACPISSIDALSWDLLSLVSDCTDREGNITQRPYPGALLQQPPWFRQAVHIVRAERNSSWLADMIKARSERKKGKA